MALRYLLKSWVPDSQKLPERDEKMLVCDALMGELDYYLKEAEQLVREKEQEEKRQKTGVDYSWLISTAPKVYEMPQIERLELEELCYQVKATETGKIMSLFRDALLNDPKPCEIPKIMRACITQILQQRPKEQTLTEWVTKRTESLVNIKLRPISKITPVLDVENPEIENHNSNSSYNTEESYNLEQIDSQNGDNIV